MTAVLISIRSKWCELIISKKKTVEIRKNRPALNPPFMCYIYCTMGNPTLNIPISDERLRADLLVNGMQSMNCPIGNGKVIGEFVCDNIQWNGGSSLIVKEDREEATLGSCVSREDLFKYLGIVPGTSMYDKRCEFYCWHISDLKIYDEPINLCELFEVGNEWERIMRPPQSWRYVEDRK